MAMNGSNSKTRKRPAREPLDEAALYEYAVRSLGRKMRTVAELKRLMRLRVEPGETGEAKMNAVVERLIETRYLDDTRYAADYTRIRQENERFGRRRVRQELVRRGVHSDIVETTLDAAYSDLPEQVLAQRFAERKRLRRPTNDKETARVVRSLVRGGFSLGVAFALLKAWKIDADVLSAVEGLDEHASEDE